LPIKLLIRGLLFLMYWHCFDGDDNVAAEFIARGFYIGINGMIFKHDLE